ncbi:MAG: phage baseplate protein [Sphingobacteriia bacterium]|nr:phage baseplate protein [Sphingobacteriia bacterium]
MSGIDSHTAELIDEMAHIRQSIQDILLTLPGERVMRRDYGSWIRALVDAPMDPVTIMDIYQSVVGAINRWEPRVLVQSVGVDQATDGGRLTFNVAVRHRATGVAIPLNGMTV